MEEAPKIVSYASLLYDRMDSEAIDEDGTRIWRGRLLATCDELGIPRGTYAKVQNKLRSTGCIEQVSRGYRGTSLSVFALHYPPTADRLAAGSDLTSGPSLDRVAASVEDLKRQLGGLDLVKAFHNIETRLAKLEKAERARSGHKDSK